MAVYQIVYDLNRPGQNYPELIEALKGVDSIHPQYSMWLVNVNQTIDSLTQALMAHIDANDRLFVSVIVKGGWRHYGMPATQKWLQDRGL
jgi:iron-sulfur cluster repair protein YtfE (RIC family)